MDKAIELKENEEGRALLIGTYLRAPQKPICDEHLEELKGLADTYGIDTVAKMAVPLQKMDPATFVHSGKIEEIIEELANSKANLIIFDEEITPAQQRNLEKKLNVAVMDRTELILEIFASRAQTKEAQLQVELAKVRYQFPRLKRLWSHFSRQRAKGGYLRGAGETQLEIDKRLLKKRVEKLQSELKDVKKYRETQKTSRLRSGVPTFAIIGYTNAGKSTLLNALTEANVLVEDKLFATLDPTTRKFRLPNNQEILLTDTVGFIRKLPHTLVAAFRSTLEAALHDDVLLLLVDVSHPLAEEHLETSYNLLKELKAQDESIIVVLNKADLVEDRTKIYRLRLKYGKTVVVSALNKTGFEDLFESMTRELEKKRVTLKLKIPQSDYAQVTFLHRHGHVIEEKYEENDVHIKVELPLTLSHIFNKYRGEI